jgi:hypothetical protein
MMEYQELRQIRKHVRNIFLALVFIIGMMIGGLFTEKVGAAGEPPMPERIPFTNKPVTPGDPESYIGTYGQCPFYENAMEKGCFPPPDIKCNADWSYCELRETTATTPEPKNDVNTQPKPKHVTTTPKSTNAGYSGAGSSSSYAPPVANEPTKVNETPKNVDIANDDVNKFMDQQRANELAKTETAKRGVEQTINWFAWLMGGLSTIGAGIGGAFWWFTRK